MLITSIQHCTGGHSQCNQARQRKGVQVRKEATLSLLTDGNPEGSIKRLLEPLSEYSKVIVYKINIQVTLLFLCIKNKQLEIKF